MPKPINEDLLADLFPHWTFAGAETSRSDGKHMLWVGTFQCAQCNHKLYLRFNVYDVAWLDFDLMDEIEKISGYLHRNDFGKHEAQHA
jgi:hypothetical protein